MKTFIIGGTGLIGSVVANKLIDLKHEVTSIALPPINKELINGKLNIISGNYLEMTDSELLNYFKGFDNLVFAAGIDERVESNPPIYELFKKYNVDALERVLKLAKQANIKKVSICGSYFTYFDRLYPNLKLNKYHPYIKSRTEQLNMALSYADNNFSVAVIELPYIFGIQENRKPVWVFLAKIILKMKRRTYYSKGGTTMITVNQAADAVIGGIIHNDGANSYPIGYYNMSWPEFFKIVHFGLNLKENRKTWVLPNFLFKIGLIVMARSKKKRNIETGLNLPKYIKMQSKNLFINKDVAISLGVKEDNIEEAIIASFKQSLKVIEDETKFVDMKGE